jgi:putative ABC transport system permease protein
MLVLVALRNLSRNRRRTALSMLVIAFGTAGVLLTLGFVRYSFAGLSGAIIQGGLGHLEIAPRADTEQAADLMDRSGIPPGLDDWRTLRDVVEGRPGVLAAGAAIQFAGVATNGDRSGAVLGVGIEPDRVRRMGMTVKVRSGDRLPDSPPVAGDDRVLLGLGLARTLDAAPGDVIVLMGATADGTLNALDLTVAGVFTSGFQDLDARLVQVHVATAGRLLATDKASSLIVTLNDTNDRAIKPTSNGPFQASPCPSPLSIGRRAHPSTGRCAGCTSACFSSSARSSACWCCSRSRTPS